MIAFCFSLKTIAPSTVAIRFVGIEAFLLGSAMRIAFGVEGNPFGGDECVPRFKRHFHC